jgi:hypothetical protein
MMAVKLRSPSRDSFHRSDDPLDFLRDRSDTSLRTPYASNNRGNVYVSAVVCCDAVLRLSRIYCSDQRRQVPRYFPELDRDAKRVLLMCSKRLLVVCDQSFSSDSLASLSNN